MARSQMKLVRGLDWVYAQRSSPLVIALTGRTGSGCSTAAKSLSRKIEEIAVSEQDFDQPERRKMSIVLEYARANWRPFSVITVSSAIFSFLLSEDHAEIDAFLKTQNIAEKGREELKEQIGALSKHASFHAFRKAISGNASEQEKADAWRYFSEAVHKSAMQCKQVLGSQYAALFQGLGDNVRFSGSALNASVVVERLFTLMDRVKILADCAQAHSLAIDRKSARIVIDAIRNPLEIVYLRRQVSSIFVIAVTADDSERKGRLLESGLTRKEVEAIDKKEYDGKKHLTDYPSFVSQNLKDCIQKADIFVANPGAVNQFASSIKSMNAQLIRYVVLALRPGLVTPTRDERCMQVAFVAKLNSGCISRQVGAVVTDGGYSIHSLGWNDTPKGQTACLLRDVGALLSGEDGDSFSDYEKTDPKFRSHVEKKFVSRNQLKSETGLRCPFCFKDAFNEVDGKKNQVHTRSLHAEENAFLQLAKRGSAGISGGVLYTTASPCELCSKKAYQLGVREVVYVDPYPGISASHVLGSGPLSARPTLRLFSGAVGHAYHRVYESILSIKDEYAARLGGAAVDVLSAIDVEEENPNLSLGLT